MGKKNNIIEINGKRYDAKTGGLLSSSTPEAEHAQHHPIHQAHHTSHPAAKPTVAKPIPVHHVAQDAPIKAKPAAKHHVHDAIKQVSKKPGSHAPQPAKTLMRSAVKRPADSLKRHTKAHGPTDALMDKPAAHLKPKPSAHRLDDQRLKLARHVPKSKLVTRFSHGVPSIAPEPPIHPAAPAAQPIAVAPAPTPIKPKVIKPVHPTADMLERALQHATSHEQPAPHIKKQGRLPRRITSISAATLALLVLGGFVAFHSVPGVKLHVASAKAGFQANLPDYQPAGYHLSHLNSQPGTVALNYHSNSDDRTYAITEKTSAWDSNALRDSFLASSGQSYQTVESAGRTLFLYGQNAATWVSGGIWYQVQGNGTLSDRQLVQLATSM